MAGTLYLVSTPIGNLGDMTLRAIEVLGQATVVLAEDTRHTKRLLSHFDIEARLVAYHDHNKEEITPSLIERLQGGDDLALVSDAGTPCVSDPGFYISRAAIDAGIRVSAVPGANAILPGLIMSGFPTDAFVFQGFLPRRKTEIARTIESIALERRTAIFFVSPHRLVKVLKIASEIMPQREMAVVREITKLHEETQRGTAPQLLEVYLRRAVKGEIVLVVKGADKREVREAERGAADGGVTKKRRGPYMGRKKKRPPEADEGSRQD